MDKMNLYIITEYAAKGDMFQRLRRLAQKRQMMPEDQAWVFFIQLCLGIKALHDNNILHRYIGCVRRRRRCRRGTAVRLTGCLAPP
eukprot:COSAG01_NODE_2324_length_7907_cov_69.755763_11_plen_86_part_00